VLLVLVVALFFLTTGVAKSAGKDFRDAIVPFE
jgi:hypothetical protein